MVKFKNSIISNQIDAIPLKQEILLKYNIQEYRPIMENFPRLLKKSVFKSLSNVYELRYDSDLSPQELAAELQKNPNVKYAEPKYLHFIDQYSALEPNDSLYALQTYLPVVMAAEAWDRTRGEQGNTVIAVIDGGTEILHPDLQQNVWINEGEIPGDSLDNDGNGRVDDVYGWNFANNSGDPTGLPTTPGNANHGTHVAGIISAVSNNNLGVSGISWNARVMAVNAGGVVRDNVIPFGYEGILYAAQNGAQVISCSWGRGGAASLYEQEVINNVTDAGALIVASAGNEGSQMAHYPSSYHNVLAVAATDDNDIRANFSNFGQDVDVSAPGVFILSTLTDSSYGRLSGTSFSCPLVAGSIGLVLTQNPAWHPLQGGEQIRVTADDIDDKNPLFRGNMGKGRLNVLKALTENLPSVRLKDLSFTETDEDSIIEPGETVAVSLVIKNYLTPVSNLSLILSTFDPYVSLLTSDVNISSLGTLEEKLVTTPFRFNVSEAAPIGHVVEFRIDMSSGPYSDFDNFKLTVLPTFTTASINNLSLTVTNIGRIGSADISDPEQGIGFRYKNGPNLLFEGAVIAATGPQRVSNAARSTGNNTDADFQVTADGNLQKMSPGTISSEETIGRFEDANADNPLNIRITQETYASNKSGREDFIIFRYTINNKNDEPLNNLHLGLFFDWDMDGGTYATNRVDFDNQRNMGYVYDSGDGPDTYVGMLPLSPGDVSFRAIYNDQDDPGNPSWGIYDAYTDAEKWESVSGGLNYLSAGPADVSAAIGLGPYTIAAHQIMSLGFALIGGDDLTALQLHADSTFNLWQEISKIDPPEDPDDPDVPGALQLNQNYPNPFNLTTIIEFRVPDEQRVNISVYNILGEKIKTLVDQVLPADDLVVEWNGTDSEGKSVAGGLYFYRMEAGGNVATRKMLFIK